MVTCVVVFPLLWLALIACTVVWIFGLSESWTLTWLIAAMWGLLAVVLTMSFLVLKHLSKGWTTAIERIAKREWQMSFRSAFMFLPVKSALLRALRQKAMGSNA